MGCPGERRNDLSIDNLKMVRLKTGRKRSERSRRHYRLYEPRALAAAVADVLDRGVRLRDAAAAHDVPVETVRRHLVRPSTSTRSGPPPVMTAAEEADLVYFLLRMADLGLALDRDQVASYVLDIVADGREHPWKDCDAVGPGRDWWESFLDRHPELAVRHARDLERMRAVMSNATVIADFYDQLRGALDGVRPEMIFNVDETKVDPRRPAVIAARGQRSVHALSDPMLQHLSLVACGNATGDLVMAPAIIAQGKNVQLSWYDDRQPDLLWASSPSGWMETSIFTSWVTHFADFVARHRATLNGSAEPVVLIFDGHRTHVTLHSVVAAEAAGIHLVKLPAHTSHLLQPLDVACFGPWHRRWGTALHQFRVKRPQTAISKPLFAALFRPAWDAAISPSHLRRGFEAAGIWPLNPERVLRRVRCAVTPAAVLGSGPASARVSAMLQEGWPNVAGSGAPGGSAAQSGQTSHPPYSSCQHHVPKRTLLARLEESEANLARIRWELEEVKATKRRREVLNFPFEPDTGAPPQRRRRVMVSGAELLTKAGVQARLLAAATAKAQNAANLKIARREAGAARRASAAAAAAEQRRRALDNQPSSARRGMSSCGLPHWDRLPSFENPFLPHPL